MYVYLPDLEACRQPVPKPPVEATALPNQTRTSAPRNCEFLTMLFCGFFASYYTVSSYIKNHINKIRNIHITAYLYCMSNMFCPFYMATHHV